MLTACKAKALRSAKTTLYKCSPPVRQKKPVANATHPAQSAIVAPPRPETPMRARATQPITAIFMLLLASCASAPGGGSAGGGGVDASKAKSDASTNDVVADGAAGSDAVNADAAGDLDLLADGAEKSSDIIENTDAYAGPACTTDKACKDLPATPYCAKLTHECVQCLISLQCADTNNCQNNQCVVFKCVPGSVTCDGNALATCNADGKSVTKENCPDDKPICSADACRFCEPKGLFCAEPAVGQKLSKTLMQCSDNGMNYSVVADCKGAQICQGGKCQVCVPGTKSCSGNVALACNDTGSGNDVFQDCGLKGLTCLGGLCVNPCSSDFKSNTNVGCDYWAVDMENVVYGDFNAQIQQFAVVISNTALADATVTVTMGDVNTPKTFKTAQYIVAAGQIEVLKLPDPAWKLPDQSQAGTSINIRAYRIQSTQPIVAYQFNPLENVNVFSNDASLLLPSYALGKTYWIMSSKQLETEFRGYFAVVATQPGATNVNVSVTCKTLQQKGQPTLPGVPPVPAIQAGQTKVFTLQQGEVLNIESDDPAGDLTGSFVEADQLVAVFGGSELAYSPQGIGNCVKDIDGFKVCAGSTNAGSGGVPCAADADCDDSCCGDHIEEQLFPVAALGQTYVAAHLYQRGKEKDAWRIVASQDNTKVTLKPSIGVVIPALAQGQVFEFQSAKDFEIAADKPILVGQYMASSYASAVFENPPCSVEGAAGDAECLAKYGYMGKCVDGDHCEPLGDPSLILAVPTSQYLSDYLFLVPDKYKINFITLVGVTGTTATLDKIPIAASSWTPIAGTNWSVVRMPIAAGAHRLLSDKGAGLTVYGYDLYVSYGYPGGAGLKTN